MSRKTVIFTLLGLAIAFSAAGLLGPLDLPKDTRVGAHVSDPETSVLAPTAASDADRRSVRLEEQVRAGSEDATVYASLALIYLQRSRASADPTLLSEAETLLERSLSLEDDANFEAKLGMASLSNARHDFTASVRWARSAINLNLYEASSYGVLGDALFELGRYRAADRVYQKMIDLRPNLASYVRASYAFQFRGNNRAAIRSMKLALQSTAPVGEDPAWLRHQLGDIYFGMGRLTEAALQNRIGSQLAPDYAPPRVGLAEVAIAEGRLNQAIRIIEDAAEHMPALEYLAKLGDLYLATGRHDEAAEQYRVTADRLRLYRAHGVLPDVDFILFYADHSLRPRKSLQEARSVYRNRPTAAAADALAWLLYRQGKSGRAWRFAKEALRYPPGDGSFYFHAGAIARDIGKDALAEKYLRQALEMKANLSVLQLKEAKTLLRSL